MAAGPTYEPIYTTTTGNSTTNTISLTSFGGYTDLIMVTTGSMTLNGFYFIQFNGNSSTSAYSQLRFLTYSAGLLTDISNTAGYFDSSVDVVTSKPGCARLHIPQYTNTNFGKTAYLMQAAQDSYNLQTCFYNSTAAITSIQLTCPGSTFFASDFEVTLYGLVGA